MPDLTRRDLLKSAGAAVAVPLSLGDTTPGQPSAQPHPRFGDTRTGSPHAAAPESVVDVGTGERTGRRRRRWRNSPDGERRRRAVDDAARNPRRRRSEHAEDRRPRSGPARGLPLPREDLPLRPRTHSRAGGARPWVRGPWLLRAVRGSSRALAGRPVPASGGAHAGVRQVLHGGGQQGIVRPRPRRTRLRREVLHPGRQLGSGRQQHSGVLHPGRDQVPRHHPLGEAAARPWLPAGPVGPRQLLGLHLADARSDPHGDVDDVGPGDPSVVPVHGGLRRPQLPPHRCRRSRPIRQVPLEAGARPAVSAVERSGEDQRRRPRLPSARPVGCHRDRRLPRVGTRCPGVRRRLCRRVRLRRLGRHQDHPGGTGPGDADRANGARPGRGQLLRRDRAGRVLHPERGARHRLHQRPAAPGPQLLVPGHAAQAPRWAELHPPAGERAEVPGRPLPAGRPHGLRQSGRSDQLRTQQGDWGDARDHARIRSADSRRSRPTSRERSNASGRSASPTTTARPANSSSARPRPNRRTSSTDSCSSCQRSKTR